MKEGEFLWEHFKLNTEQRLKGFNFFVLMSIFADGGVFTALEKQLGSVLILLLGFFLIVLSGIFWLVDARSRELIHITIPGLKKLELEFSEESRIFARDDTEHGRFVRFTFAFRALLLMQMLFGAGVAIHGVSGMI